MNGKIMHVIRKSRTTKILCFFLAINLLGEIFSPTLALALTSGPSQPEFSSFEPVATTDMVNDFNGDFTYNLPVLSVPGPDGGGYSMSLSYHSGVSSEEEASWVGFGWTLNPGAINRNKRGYADEFNGVNVDVYNKTKPNWTQSAKFDFNMEYRSRDAKKSSGKRDGAAKAITKLIKKAFSAGSSIGGNEEEKDGSSQDVGNVKDPADISLSLSHTIRYNNYSGFSIANGVGLGTQSMASLSMNRSGAQNTYGFTVDFNNLVRNQIYKKLAKNAIEKKKTLNPNNKSSWILSDSEKEELKKKAVARAHLLPLNYSVRTFEAPVLPYSVAETEGLGWNFSVSAQLNAAFAIGYQLGIAGNLNISATKPKVTQAAYGYMNSSAANNGGGVNKVFDYQLEKASTFDKRDKYLGIPHNTADMFVASGNGVTGGFRFYHENIGSFYPNHTESKSRTYQAGPEFGIGSTFQVGIDRGVGFQKTKTEGNWPKMPDNNTMSTKKFSSSIPSLRFNGDLGGEVKYSQDYDKLQYATILSNKKLDLNSDFDLARNNNFGSSSYIEFSQASGAAGSNNPSINGITVTAKDGGRFKYGQAVFVRNEKELTVGVPVFEDGKQVVTSPLYVTDPLQNKTVIGSSSDSPYASTYLLTESTTSNYIDADGDGKASENDFGGWTKFNYRCLYGGTGPWYRYRSPYTGLHYNRGRILDLNDGTGSMSSGEKEIYYLKSIQTKSHIAFFVTDAITLSKFMAEFPQQNFKYLYDNNNQLLPGVAAYVVGSGNNRSDGLDADVEADASGVEPSSINMQAKGQHKLEKLEKIVLFSKSDCSSPISTTYFDYDYSLCQGIPNTNATVGASGKLTLRKVWTESGGVIKSRISPYEFHYEYFHAYPTEITAKYPWAQTDYNAVYVNNDARQNPSYNPWALDPWGFYQTNGDKRVENMQTWVSQTAYGPSFDPAAWQLKRIKLPSGGEIHIQYEQKNYLFVQDKRAMAMVSLLPDENKDGYTSDESVFCINADSIGVNTSDPIAVSSYTTLLQEHFINQHNKLYFKMLYAFTGNATPQLNTEKHQFEYVSGYTAVNKVSMSNGGKILLHLGDTREYCDGKLTLKNDKTLPRYVCYQELLSSGGSNLGLNAQTYKSRDYTSDAYNSGQASVDLAQLIGKGTVDALSNTGLMFVDWVSGRVSNTPKKKACKKINFDLSYFKLPVYQAKKGGGIRVKRLLTYDPGISGETGSAMLYGSEYLYENEDGTSSGVATNEPASIHEENALVGFIERKKQKWLERITNGRDTKQYEGPIGENLLPGASVSYGRVVIKNIHSDKSTTGFTVNTYFTAKDFPIEVDYSGISKKDKTYSKRNFKIPIGIMKFETNRAWVTQGYLFKLNDMHGKIASKAVYAGTYDRSTFSESASTRKTTFQYSAPGEKIASLLYDKSNKTIVRDFLNPGTEEDFTIYTAKTSDKLCDFSIELDFNYTTPILPGISKGISCDFIDNMLCQHVTNKVIRQVSYLLSTTTVNDGVTQTTQNLAFDRYTGDPVLTKTFDSYMAPGGGSIYTNNNGSNPHLGHYYSLNIPASWVYSSFEPMSYNPNGSNQLSIMAGNVVTYSTNALYSAINTANSTISWSPYSNSIGDVINASATIYTNNWFNSGMISDFPGLSTASVLNEANNFYYPLRSYTYKDQVKSANQANGKIYEGGVCTNPFVFFDWQTLQANPSTTIATQWFSPSKITRYSPNGYPLEEEDILSIKSNAKFGYNNMLPVSVAQNAAYNETKFIDFEYGISTNTAAVTATQAHTGRSSFILSSAPTYTVASAYPTDISKGVSVKVWLNSSLSTNVNNPNYKLKNSNPQFKVKIGGKEFDFKSIAQTGEWTLFSADIIDFQGLPSGNYDITLKYNYQPNELVYIDDIRIQPLNATMNCSVYYANNKLAAQFDDQHFAVLYEYNGKGQLVRKSIETERGRKTLQEQQYNTPTVQKPN